MGAEFLFMDDNARPHRANIVDESLQSDYITRMDWPAYSPDLNPIEHVSGVQIPDLDVSRQTDHQTGTSAHAPQCGMSRKLREAQ
ncbi:DDE_3 domain-containing protein [Trichonephila clavipes]|nr:DDE_3 domain-containing protein [Trichonephila clavipes]